MTYPITYALPEYEATRFWAARGSRAAALLFGAMYYPGSEVTIYLREADAHALVAALQDPDDTLLSGVASGALADSLLALINMVV